MLRQSYLDVSEEEKAEHYKTVYAHAGLALYHAQIFEEELSIFIIAHSLANKELGSSQEYDLLEESLRSKTLGALLKNAKQKIYFSASAEKIIDQALAERNYLAHDFFKDFAPDWFTVEKRDDLISKLQSYQQTFTLADKLVSTLSRQMLKDLSVSDEMVARELEKMKNGSTQ